MSTKYQIELADNGMIIRREDSGDIRVFEYIEKDDERDIASIAQWIGEDILDDMLESPDMKEESEKLLQRTGEDCINNYEICVELKPIIK